MFPLPDIVGLVELVLAIFPITKEPPLSIDKSELRVKLPFTLISPSTTKLLSIVALSSITNAFPVGTVTLGIFPVTVTCVVLVSANKLSIYSFVGFSTGFCSGFSTGGTSGLFVSFSKTSLELDITQTPSPLVAFPFGLNVLSG